jgi:hypothetical protein
VTGTQILEITRGHIRLQVGDKVVTVQGEGYAREYGSPDFVIFKNSIQRWDPPFVGLEIDERTREQILDALKTEMSKKKITIEIE